MYTDSIIGFIEPGLLNFVAYNKMGQVYIRTTRRIVLHGLSQVESGIWIMSCIEKYSLDFVNDPLSYFICNKNVLIYQI